MTKSPDETPDPCRTELLQHRFADSRGGRIVLLSHCLLNENVRYLGGAGRAGGVQEVVDDYLGRGVGIYQLPCPEQHAWGGVLKRRMLLLYGAGGTWRAPAARLLTSRYLRYTRFVYRRLARRVAKDVVDYRRSGVDVVGFVGVGGSPSCGVRTTLDLPGAVSALCRFSCPQLDRDTLNQSVIAANVRPGEGMFASALRQRLEAAGLHVDAVEHDLIAELAATSGTPDVGRTESVQKQSEGGVHDV